MLLSIKIELKPNNKQSTKFKKACGIARHAYNWGNSLIKEVLEKRKENKTVKVPTAIDLHKKLVAEVKIANPWYYEVNSKIPQQALKDLRVAWEAYFKKISREPKYKKKGVKDSFYLESGTKTKPKILSDGKRIKLPRIGWVHLAEQLPVTATHNCVISRTANKWFLAIKYEVEKPPIEANRPIIGVDIGINKLAVCSNGTVFSNPKAYKKASKRLKLLNSSVSRKQKGSNNRKKAVAKLAKLHARVANIRKDAIHKLTTYLAKNHGVVKIEDLNVKAFLKNHRLAGAIADCGMYEFRRQLEYKTEKFSSLLVLVDRTFPSSQICSNCKTHRHKMPLKERIYICPNCNHIQDRDLNAAKNLERWFEGTFIPERSDVTNQTASSAEIVCGVDKPFGRQAEAIKKQEVNTENTYI